MNNVQMRLDHLWTKPHRRTDRVAVVKSAP
jgi:hypothetical protein